MTRGFDQFNRVFSLVEPPSKLRAQELAFSDGEQAAFAPISAAALVANRWFAVDDRAFHEDLPPVITLNEDGDVKVTAEHGLRYLGFSTGGEAVGLAPLPIGGLAPTRYIAKTLQIIALAKTDDVLVRALDHEGQLAQVELRPLRRGLRTWQFASETRDWTSSETFLELSQADRETLVRSAEKSRATTSPTGFIDFRSRSYPRSESVAGYALRKFTSPEPRKVKLLAGSDDAIRIWIDGTLVHSKLALRAARPDEDSAEVNVGAGPHVLLVEVSQSRGDWGFYLRLEDDRKKPLTINASDQLVLLGP
jgi:hypothetical protein